jgi:transcriptional regulator with XRE-family HTH domain
MSLKKLADALGLKSHGHLSEVLAGKRNHGGQTRKKVAPLLTPAELELLGWDAEGNLSVPRGTDISTIQTCGQME